MNAARKTADEINKHTHLRAGRKAVFTSTDSEYRELNGTLVEIVRQLDDTEADEEVGRMYAVRRVNGCQFHAFEDELEPVCLPESSPTPKEPA